MNAVEVLAAHLFTLYPGEIACDCEWTKQDDDTRQGERRMIAAHVAHVAAVLEAGPIAEAERRGETRRMDYAAVMGYELGYHEGAQRVLAAFDSLFGDGPDTVCRTMWREAGGGWPDEECVVVPMADLRDAFAAARAGAEGAS